MQEVTMTVHEALVEVKVNTKRIQQSITETNFCAANKQSSTKIGGRDVSAYMSETKATYQSISDLIKRTEAIKAALSLSNAKTEITVMGKTMTVAEAVYYLGHGLDAKESLLNALVAQYKVATQKVDMENGDKLDNKVDKFIADTYGSKEKASSDEISTAMEAYRKSQSFVLLDPVDIASQIKQLKQEIDDFKTSVDSALQISNANTTITFSY